MLGLTQNTGAVTVRTPDFSEKAAVTSTYALDLPVRAPPRAARDGASTAPARTMPGGDECDVMRGWHMACALPPYDF